MNPREPSFEDKHLFGFTEGSDVGEAESVEAEFTSTVAFGKRGDLQKGPDAFLALAWPIQAASLPRQLTSGLETWNQADLARHCARTVFGVEF